MSKNGFKYTFADYEKHNSESFDPYENKAIGNKPFGNYGINSTRNAVHYILKKYHFFSIAASQVDIVAHSMGGLMARGFAQQTDYYNQTNFMKGSIHRLITIGTPHFGGHLSKFLYDHRDKIYCFDGIQMNPAQDCKVEPKKLRTIYDDNFKSPIDKGAVEGMIPESDAYSHLCQTNVKSYAIAGSWKPNAKHSHESQERDYRCIIDKFSFNLDTDGFHDDNDLVVSVTSQLGGLPCQFRQIGSNNIPTDDEIPNKSAVYPNTVHASSMIKGDNNVTSETYSPDIQRDVIALLNSSDNNKFADAIGIGSPCHPSK